MHPLFIIFNLTVLKGHATLYLLYHYAFILYHTSNTFISTIAYSYICSTYIYDE